MRSWSASARRLRDAELKVEIESVHKENLEVYGIEKGLAPADRKGTESVANGWRA